MKNWLLILFSTFIFNLNAHNVTLNGKWSIAIDPLAKGIENDWHVTQPTSTDGLVKNWGVVTVPHSYTLDSRYNIIGKVWYKRSFNLDANIKEKVCRLRFSGVFYSSRIWVNGQFLGSHLGGYTAFEYDISKFVKPNVNFIAVEVDNSWNDKSIPGARVGTNNNEQVYPWYEYGGITRDVNLIITDKVFITKQKIEQVIDFKKNTAIINIKTWTNLHEKTSQNISFEGFLAYAQTPLNPIVKYTSQNNPVEPYLDNKSQISLKLNSTQLKLWDVDNPNLYVATTIVRYGNYADTIRTRFGIRKIEAKNGQLLLNGQPIRMGGANRQMDTPGFGSLEPQNNIEKDMRLMKSGNMLLQRLHHTPSTERLLNWADENGMLIIEELPVWQTSEVQLMDPMFQALAINQSREMIENNWNRPSVIGWCCGNEYSTWTPEADAYTKIMTDYFRSIDSERLATMITHIPASLPQNIAQPYNSFRHCDIICVNYYLDKGLEEHLERLHSKFPEKPVLMTEFGSMEKDKIAERENNLIYNMSVIRKYPYVVGASWWTYNDYKSRYPGTTPEGYRTFGMVSPTDEKRPLYFSIQREFCPLIVEKEATELKISARIDFPSFIVKGYSVRLRKNNEKVKEWLLPTLSPGDKYSISLTGLTTDKNTFEIVNANGFVIYEIN